jgi:hypothetical protein
MSRIENPGGSVAAGADKQVQFNDAGAVAGNASLTFDKASSQLTVLGDVVLGNDHLIRLATVDGADNAGLSLVGGGAIGGTRGSGISCYGNEVGAAPGQIRMYVGNVAGSKFLISLANGSSGFEVDGATGAITTPAPSVVFTQDAVMRRSTADGADNGAVTLAGGGATGQTRGAQFSVFGKEAVSPGSISAYIGNVAGARFDVNRSNGAAAFGVDGATGDTRSFRNDGNQSLTIDGTTGLVKVPFGQVQFPSTDNLSTDPYTLDSYREVNAYTPTDQSGLGLTFTFAQGNYVKIGSFILVTVNVAYPPQSNGAAIAISVPYTAYASGLSAYGAAVGYTDYTTSGVYARVPAGYAIIQLFTTGSVQMTNAMMSGKSIHITAMYRV